MSSRAEVITRILAGIFRLPDTLLALVDELLERLRRRGLGDAPAAVVLLLPGLLLLTVFILVPMGSTFYMSLFGGRHGMGPFVGVGNYVDALGSLDFRQSLLVTVYYVLGVIPISMVLSFLVAYGLYRIKAFRGLAFLLFPPYVTRRLPPVWRSSSIRRAALSTCRWIPGDAQQWPLSPAACCTS